MTEFMRVISLQNEKMKNAMISECEGHVLLLLSYKEKGKSFYNLKRILSDLAFDEDSVEESVQSLKTEGYIRYNKRMWFLTDDGQKLLKDIATVEEA